MQAVGTKNRTSLHSIDGSAFKTRGSLSIGRGVTFVREEGGHFPSEFPYIVKERLLLETDSPFTYGRGTHAETLEKIKVQLEGSRDELSLWNNFKKVLE